jgi:hypothetical protein
MLFNTHLEEIIFHRHQTVQSNELVILSGYLGPNPVARLATLPFNSTVIYGMYGDKGIQYSLHNALLHIQNSVPNVNIYYSKVPIHSKCYIWKNNRIIQHALIGSANFSTNGLTTPYREILAETTHDTFQPLHEYVDRVMANSTLCTDIVLSQQNRNIITTPSIQISTQFCRMSLLDRGGNVPEKSGLNWMFSNGHVAVNDAYIAIRKEYIRQYPNLFPPKQGFTTLTDIGGRANRHNDIVEIIWDDGITMDALLEGNQDENGLIYPKQISSFPRKNFMGAYIRHRLGLPDGYFVTLADLNRYGRTHIDISLLDEGIYYFDFSVR